MASQFHILIVDDETFLVKTLTMILRDAGYQVSGAKTGGEALQLLSEMQYDLILLDLVLPDINGLDLLSRISTPYPAIPVLVLTANASLDSTVEALRRGASDYLLKPIPPGELLSKVKDIADLSPGAG